MTNDAGSDYPVPEENSPGSQLLWDEEASALCSRLPTRMLLTGCFIDILRRHFSDAQNIQETKLRNLTWNPTDASRMLIEAVTQWRPQMTERRPAIIVKPNGMQTMRRGVGNRRQLPPHDQDGNGRYAVFWLGSHTLFCLGGTGAQAEILASEVQRQIGQFAPVLAPALSLLRLQVIEVGEIHEVEEATENFIVPVTIGYSFEEKWVLAPQVPRLKEISLKMLLET